MTLDNIKNVFESFKNQEMNLLYSGNFTDELTSKIIELNNNQFVGDKVLERMQRKTGFLIAECFQNIVRYSNSRTQDSFFHIEKIKGAFSIVSGNIIQKSNVPELEAKLKNVNELNDDELKKVYSYILANGELSDKGGAGLGLIEMARKSRNELNFVFENLDGEQDYFYFQIQLSTDKLSDTVNGDKVLQKSILHKRKMLEQHIFLIYKGDISMPIILPILDMVEDTIDIPRQKKVYFVLVEMLQNISKFGAKKGVNPEGMTIIGKKDNTFFIGGINYVKDSEIDTLKDILGKYSVEDKAFLKKEYKKLLLEEENTNSRRTNIGFLEMARKSSSIEYAFEKAQNDCSIFYLFLSLD